MITLVVNIEPKPTPRPRVAKHGGTYYPAKYKTFKHQLTTILNDHEKRPKQPIITPIELELQFFIQNKSVGRATPHTSRGDVDNYAKSVMDALQDAGYIQDDAQVYKLLVTKWKHQHPGLITIRIIEQS